MEGWNNRFKFKEFFLSYYSKKYQRLLAGFRIYISLMGQRSFINFSILILLMLGIMFTIVGLGSYYGRLQMNISAVIMPLAFAFVPSFILMLMIQYREWNLKPLKGYLIFLRNPLSILISLIYIVMMAILLYNEFSIEYVGVSLGYFVFIQLFTIYFQMGMYLKTSSLISYSKEKLEDIINISTRKNTKVKKSNIQLLFYYSIYTYYKKLLKKIRATYKDDVILYFQLDKIPFLASQIHTEDKVKREKLSKILTDLEQVLPLKNPDEYIKIMEEIDSSYRESLNIPKDEIIIRRLFREKTIFDNMKLYLIPLIPIVSIAVNIFLDYLK